MSLDQVMKELRVEYLSSISSKFPMYREMAKLRRAAEIQDEFHKLKGTGSTYGIPEISALGELVETLFIQKPSEGLRHFEMTLELLEQIIHCRQEENEFPLLSNTSYEKLQSLIESTKPKRFS